MAPILITIFEQIPWDLVSEDMRYIVQFELPVNNPEDKVRMTLKGSVRTFFVPINHPNAHTMGFQQLIEAKERGMNSATIHNP